MNSNHIMLIDLDSCSGRHACSVSCKAEHRAPNGNYRHRVQYVESGQFPNAARRFVPTLCQQCTDAPCITACPVNAIRRTDTGIVVIDSDVCIGSGECIAACPYDAIYLDPEANTAVKCDFCQGRLAAGEQPACASTCPTDAIVFGSTDDPAVTRHLQTGNYTQWQLGATDPNVWYKGLTEATEKKLMGINANSNKEPARGENGK